MAAPRTAVAMRPEHWMKLAAMAKKADPSLSDADVDALIHSEEVMSAIASGRIVQFTPELIAKYATNAKTP